MPNSVTQFQILSKQPDESAAFYAAVFGWTVDASNALGYRRINTGTTEGIQGGIWPAPPQATNFVQLFVSVDDIRATVGKAEEAGAKLLIPPTTLPDGDEIAVLLDSQGMPFGIWRANKE